MSEVIRIDASTLFPREFKTLTRRTLKYEAYYKDVNSHWTVGIDAIVDDELAVKRQLENLFGTPVGTEHFAPGYGSDIPYRLMDNINEFTAYVLESDTFIAVWTWMRDRIRLDHTRSRIYPLEEQDGYLIDLRYLVLKSSKLVTYAFEIVR